MAFTYEEALSRMTPDKYEQLHKLVTPKPVVNTDIKANSDILMTALCTAVSSGLIKLTSLDDRTIKLLNSETSTLSPSKLCEILKSVRQHQPYISCVITLNTGGPDNETVCYWVFNEGTVHFHGIFEFIIERFNITPQMIRSEMVKNFKPSTVNNIAQYVAGYDKNDESKYSKPISITTITRLANMVNHVMLAEFKEMQ